MDATTFFPGFDAVSIDVGETAIFARRGGAGPPVLLLHGFPETHLMWHRVAPALADTFTVVCADLRGYGRSGKPASHAGHRGYSKRSMAVDMVRLMEALGFPRFSVAGHDRGGRVAYRMALDHADRVAGLAVLDIIPTCEAFRRADARFALAFWPWSPAYGRRRAAASMIAPSCPGPMVASTSARSSETTRASSSADGPGASAFMCDQFSSTGSHLPGAR